MQKDWEYTIDAYGDCVTVHRNIDNTISTVYVDVDGYATRDWTEEEVDAGYPDNDPEWMGEDEPQFTEFAKGAFAQLKFDVDDGVATFSGVRLDDYDPEDYDFPTWLRLLIPASKIVENVPGVESSEDPADMIHEQMSIGDKMAINGLDGS